MDNHVRLSSFPSICFQFTDFIHFASPYESQFPFLSTNWSQIRSHWRLKGIEIDFLLFFTLISIWKTLFESSFSGFTCWKNMFFCQVLISASVTVTKSFHPPILSHIFSPPYSCMYIPLSLVSREAQQKKQSTVCYIYPLNVNIIPSTSADSESKLLPPGMNSTRFGRMTDCHLCGFVCVCVLSLIFRTLWFPSHMTYIFIHSRVISLFLSCSV